MGSLFTAWSNLTLRKKAAWLALVAGLPLFLCLFFFLSQIHRLVDDSKRALDTSMRTTSMVVVESNLMDWVNAVLQYSHSAQPEHAAGIIAFEDCPLTFWLVGSECAFLKRQTPEVVGLLNAAEGPHAAAHYYAMEIRALVTAGKMDVAQKMYREELIPRTTKLSEYLARARILVEQKLQGEYDRFTASTSVGNWWSLAFASMFLLLTAAVAFIINRTVERPLQSIATVAQSVERGDLDSRTGLCRSDEIGYIAGTFDAMLGTLQAQIVETDKRMQFTKEIADRLTALSVALQSLLQSEEQDFDMAVNDALRVISRAMGADSAYIWANYTGDDGRIYCDQIYQWTGDNKPAADASGKRVCLEEVAPDWLEGFLANKCVYQVTTDTVPGFQKSVGRSSTQSFCVAPIFLQTRLWGFIELADCHSERIWQEEDKDLLRSAGVLLSASIEHYQLEMQLGSALVAAEGATKAKGEFLARMSHELRTPLNAITGLTYLALHEPDTCNHNKYFTRIQNASSTLLSIVNDVLDFSRIEANKLELESVSFSPRECLSSVMDMLFPRAIEKNIHLECRIAPNLPHTLIGDPLRVRQVLLNLVSNAVKFTEEGGVLVELDVLDNNAEEATLHFCIMDSGIGMTEAQTQLLFQPFSQTDGSITRRYGGSGLGLVICKELIDKMGGYIQVKSGQNQGSTFSFAITLPQDAAVREQGPVVQDSAASDIPDFSGRHILLVEDNAVNQLIVCNLLELAGATVTVAENGVEAVEKVKSFCAQCGGRFFDIILMDVQMPVMDGLAATAQIRQLACGDSVPIVALTAHTMASDYAKSIEVGMNDHITKPVEPSYLYTVMARWMGK